MFNFKKLGDIFKQTKIPENIIDRGLVGLGEFLKPFENVLNQMKPPDKGWSDNQIRVFLEFLAHMDSNNDPSAYQIGEREGRISTPLLYELSGGFIHGIGRSGDIKAPQPKAAGGSLINKLTDSVVTFFIKESGLENIKGSIVVPLSTGMSIMLTIRGLYNRYSEIRTKKGLKTEKNAVIYPRTDHKSPMKAIALAGMELVNVKSTLGHEYLTLLKSNKKREFVQNCGFDAVFVPPEMIEEKINEKTFAILSTTTFFPPRAPDNVKEIAKIAEKHDIVHIINNAYGVQSRDIMKLIRGAIDAGRVDAIIQSSDKNFLCPVGGAIISSPVLKNLDYISGAYAGRGSSAPVLQLLVSLLSMGIDGYKHYIKNQRENRILLEEEMEKLATILGEKVLDVKNPIACMMTLDSLQKHQIEKLGGYLYNLRVTGPRVINLKDKKAITFGPCTDEYPHPYIVMNSAIGTHKKDIIGAVKSLKKAFQQIKD
ncbi:MAG: O-phosphoseryl-tRNA(Sec) selenium transferase [Promethearchaeota archaeon]